MQYQGKLVTKKAGSRVQIQELALTGAQTLHSKAGKTNNVGKV